MKTSRTFGRRNFLVGLGAASQIVPLLPSLARAVQAAGKAPLRVVFIKSPNGAIEETFFPSQKAQTQVEPNLWTSRLSDISGNISQVLGPAFNGVRNKMTVLRGLDFVYPAGFPHNRRSFLTACADNPDPSVTANGFNLFRSPSVDWILENSNNFYSTPAQRREGIRFELRTGYGEFTYGKTASGIEMQPYFTSDQGLFSNVFGNFTGGTGTGTAPRDFSGRRKMIADKMIERVSALKNHPRIGTVDKHRLQDHVDLMQGLKSRFLPPKLGTGRAPSLTFFQGGKRSQLYHNVNDIIVSAFNADITRIASVYIEDYDDYAQDYAQFHGWSHNADPASQASFTKAGGWIAERVLDLALKLDSITDVDGSTMLDNTLVVWGNELGSKVTGQGESHNNSSMPLVVFGGANTNLKSGYYIDYRQWPLQPQVDGLPAIGRPYAQFLASVMLALGLRREEFDPYGEGGIFGDFHPVTDTGTGYNHGLYDKFRTTRSQPLPFYVSGA